MESLSYKQILIQEPRASSSTRIEELQPLETQSSTISKGKNQMEDSMEVDEILVSEEDGLTDCSKFE